MVGTVDPAQGDLGARRLINRFRTIHQQTHHGVEQLFAAPSIESLRRAPMHHLHVRLGRNVLLLQN